MAKRRKKKGDKWAALLLFALAILILALWLSGWGTDLSAPNILGKPLTNETDKCCCDNMLEWIIQLPDGPCQCIRCVDAYDNLIIEADGTICCTDRDCTMEGEDSEDSDYNCEWYKAPNCRDGTCPPGLYCVDAIGGGCGCAMID